MSGASRPRSSAGAAAMELARSIQEGIPVLNDLKSMGCDAHCVRREFLCFSYHFSWKGIYGNVADETARDEIASALYCELNIGMTPEEIVERSDRYEQIIAETSEKSVIYAFAREFLGLVKAPEAEGYVVIMALALGAHLSGIAGLSNVLAKLDFD